MACYFYEEKFGYFTLYACLQTVVFPVVHSASQNMFLD